MIAALIIVFREVFEAGLIIGIVLAVTRTVPHRNRWIGGGVLAGVLAACLVAVFAGALSNLFAGMGQELFNAAILTIAVVMLTWHNVWMARHGSELAGELRAAGQAVVEGSKSLLALAVVVGVAVLREGSEVVLFLYGVVAAESDTGWTWRSAALSGWRSARSSRLLTYFGLVRIPTRALVHDHHRSDRAARRRHGGAGGGVSRESQLADGAGQRRLGFGWLLSDSSIPGKALHTLIGYTDQPTAMQLVVYVAILAVTFVLMRLYGAPVKQAAAARG